MAACFAAVAAALLLTWLGSDAYESVLGVTHPTAATSAVVVLGYLAWRITVQRRWIPSGTGGRKGYGMAVSIGFALTVPVMVVDYLGGFRPDINASAPDSLLFYPSVALLAEFAFHMTPLALAAVTVRLWASAARPLEGIALVVAATLEPVLQVVWGQEYSPTWANIYTGIHLLVFNVVGLYLLRRYGFLRVYLYRVSYYAVWHIAWGYVRVELLFSA